jgi:PBP1b-binding outer membrane lipoprotein LpoB
MRHCATLLILAVVASCSPEQDATGSVNKCATDLFHPYDPKNLEQCVAACRQCDRGTSTTCTTSCTLKGAR